MSRVSASAAPEPDAEAAVEGDRVEDPRAREILRRNDVALLRADNPGPLTLSGTNTWLVGRDPTWVLDPGPALDEHLARLLAAIDRRGGLGGVVLTHEHADHADAAAPLLRERPAQLPAAGGGARRGLGDGERCGPFEALATPGHSAEHVALIAGEVCFTGDAVLGEGSVFVSPYPGAMSAYLDGLERLHGRAGIELLCPGHGPPIVDVAPRLEHYIAHRMERERALLAALDDGLRSVRELLDRVWSDVPTQLRAPAAVTLAAHLDRLQERGLLPDGVERPTIALGAP
jgi:glyoxylase-like metal-dependent hydrolase (beta-lactamase superfamily II)